jgi:hypothetical protein
MPREIHFQISTANRAWPGMYDDDDSLDATQIPRGNGV